MDATTGDVIQPTTTGVFRYRASTGVTTYVQGDDYWAFGSLGNVTHWTGDSLDPPPGAALVAQDAVMDPTAVPPAPTPIPPVAAVPTPTSGVLLVADVPPSARLTLPDGSPVDVSASPVTHHEE